MTQTINLGAFLSSAKGFLHMGKEAKEADMQTMSFFLRNPRGGKAKPLDEADMRAFSAAGGRPRALYHEPLLAERKHASICPGNVCRRYAAHGIYPRQFL